MIPCCCRIAERSPQGWFRGRRQLAGRVWATAASGWEQPSPGRQAQDNHNIVSLPSDQVSFEDWSQFSWYSYLGCCWSGVTPAQGLSVLVPWWGWWWWWWWFKGGGWSLPWWFWFWWFFTGIRVSQGVAAIIRGDVRPKCRSNWKKKNNSNLFAFLKKTQSCWKWKTTHTICFNPASMKMFEKKKKTFVSTWAILCSVTLFPSPPMSLSPEKLLQRTVFLGNFFNCFIIIFWQLHSKPYSPKYVDYECLRKHDKNGRKSRQTLLWAQMVRW